jgi:hypothetical protein
MVLHKINKKMKQILIELRTTLKLIIMELDGINEIELKRQLQKHAELTEAKEVLSDLIQDLQNEDLQDENL